MPYTEVSANLDALKRRLRRVLLNGPPNSRKTSSARSAYGPVVIQSYPGEKGTASIPFANFEGTPIKAFAWEEIDVSKPQNWEAIWRETRKLTVDILSGKHGPVTTFMGDGLHKLYQVILASKVDGANFTGDDFDAKAYSKSHAEFWSYIDLVVNSPVPYVICTCWDGAEKDNPLDDSKESNKRRHIYPELPGQAAKKAMGEFSLVLYAGQEGAGAAARYFWQTRPQGFVWGAGLKVPADLMERMKIPATVAQDWAKLDGMLVGELERAWREIMDAPKKA